MFGIHTLKHFVPPGNLVHPTSHPVDVVVVVHPLGFAALHVSGSHLKKPKKPQDTVHVAVPAGNNAEVSKDFPCFCIS